MKKTVGMIIGSMRKNSFSQSIAEYIRDNAPTGYVFKTIEINNLPLYNQDYDGADPEEYIAFRKEILSLDGVLFITPEHNRSMPAALKNALDVGSRPYGKNVWNGKPGAVISQSPGKIGGFGANYHLRQVLTYLNVLTLSQPEVCFSSYHTLVDKDGRLSDAQTKEYLDNFLIAFTTWIETVS